MGEKPFTPPATPVEQATELDGVLPRIVELVQGITPNCTAEALDIAGWTCVCILFRQSPASSSAGENGRVRLPYPTLTVPDKWPGMEKFAWALKDSRGLRTLKRFFLIGWAYRDGATSLRGVLRKLRPHRQSLGAENVPASTKDYSDCVKEVTERFRSFLPAEGTEELELFARKGEKPVFTAPGYQDTRAIIGLTEDGWSAWTETGHFLAFYGGHGPWDASEATLLPPPAAR